MPRSQISPFFACMKSPIWPKSHLHHSTSPSSSTSHLSCNPANPASTTAAFGILLHPFQEAPCSSLAQHRKVLHDHGADLFLCTSGADSRRLHRPRSPAVVGPGVGFLPGFAPVFSFIWLWELECIFWPGLRGSPFPAWLQHRLYGAAFALAGAWPVFLVLLPLCPIVFAR